MELTSAKRISIVGNSGAGKSTLSKYLGKYLGIDVFTIDKIYWLSGWKLRDQRSYKEKHDHWTSQDSWIIDGVGYWEELEDRVQKSDLVIFLDVPLEICKERARYRIEQERFSPNLDITEGCVYGEMEKQQMEVIEYFHNEFRPRVQEVLSRAESDKVKIIDHLSDLAMKNET